jgi:hypothetical protein
VLVLVGCGKDDDNGGKDTPVGESLIGTWVSEETPDVVWKFTDTEIIRTYYGTENTVSYTTSGGKITIANWDGEVEGSYSINDGKLTIIGKDEDGEEFKLVFVKKS